MIGAKLKRAVRERAGGRCEYCQLLEGQSEESFAADHIIAIQHHGPTALENLAFACARCNRHKGPNLSGIDPATKQIAPLFNPRVDTWSSHFTWAGAILEGLTPTGRASIDVLDLNDPMVVTRRSLLILLGEFPPKLL
jgi:hypothetical protein